MLSAAQLRKGHGLKIITVTIIVDEKIGGVCRVRGWILGLLLHIICLLSLFFWVPGSLVMAQEDQDPFAGIRGDEGKNVSPIPPPSTSSLRLSFEMLERLSCQRDTAECMNVSAVGMEAFSRILTPTGTWGSFDAQLRLAFRAPEERFHLETHNLYLEKRLFFGRLNLYLGHFLLPFNLEALPIDTHTTVMQFSNMAIYGFKHDWGLGARGEIWELQYHLAYTLGIGMGYDSPTLPGIATVRLGYEIRERGLGFGISAIAGEHLIKASLLGHEARKGVMAGVDGQYTLGYFQLLSEGSVGRDDGQTLLTTLGRLAGETPGKLFTGTLQYSVIHAKTRKIALNGKQIDKGYDPYRASPTTPEKESATKHRLELEGAFRLSFITTDTFFRIHYSVHWMHGQGKKVWMITGQFYLNIGG